jgi:hypothetical protein
MYITEHQLDQPEIMTPLVQRILNQIGNKCIQALNDRTGVVLYSLPEQKSDLIVQIEQDTYNIVGAFSVEPEAEDGALIFVLVGISDGILGIFTPVEQITEPLVGQLGGNEIEAITADQIHLIAPLP